MNYGNHIESTRGTKPSYTSENNSERSSRLLYGNTLSPEARAAREIIPQDIVARRATIYGRQVNQLKIPEDNTAQLTKAYQDTVDQSNNEKKTKNISLLRNRNKITNKTPYTELPQEMKELIFSFLGVEPLNALSVVSKETNMIVKADYFQKNLALDFALNKTLSISDIKLKCDLLYNIAKKQTINGYVERARVTLALTKDIILLLKNPSTKCQMLREIAVLQAENTDTDGAKETFTLAKETALSIKDREIKRNKLLRGIAAAQAKSGNIKEVKTTLILAKETALLIKNDRIKCILLQKIAIKQAQNGDIVGAKETLHLLNDRAKVLKEIAIAQAKNGDTKEAQNTALQIEDNDKKFDALYTIAETLHKNGNTAKVKEILDLLEIISSPIKDAVQKSLSLIAIGVMQSENGDIDRAKGTFALSKDIALLIKDTIHKPGMLQEIAEEQAKNGSIKEAKETFTLAKDIALLIEDDTHKSIMLQEIATSQAKSGDTDGAKETFTLAKNIALLIKSNNDKSFELQKIATSQAEAGDIDEAQKTLDLLKDTISLLKSERSYSLLGEFSIIQAKIGNVEKAKEILISLRDKALQSKSFNPNKYNRIAALISIAKKQAKIGDIIGAKDTLHLIENNPIVSSISSASSDSDTSLNSPSSSSSSSNDFNDSSSSSSDFENDANIPENNPTELSEEDSNIVKEHLSHAFYKIVKMQIQHDDIVGAKETITYMREKGHTGNLINAALAISDAAHTAK